jgi:hypothetical protein
MKKNKPQITLNTKHEKKKSTDYTDYTDFFVFFIIGENLCNLWTNHIKNNEKPGGSKIAGMPQISTQIFDKGYLSPWVRFKGILTRLKESRPGIAANRAFMVSVILGILSRLKRV